MDYYFETIFYHYLLTFSPTQLSMYKLISKSSYKSYTDNIKCLMNNTFTPITYKEIANAIRLYNTDEELARTRYNHIAYWNTTYLNIDKKELVKYNR